MQQKIHAFVLPFLFVLPSAPSWAQTPISPTQPATIPPNSYPPPTPKANPTQVSGMPDTNPCPQPGANSARPCNPAPPDPYTDPVKSASDPQ
jgi:hypothetical protein